MIKLENVKKRVENFKYFMENLESASVVEMTSEITKINRPSMIRRLKEKHNILNSDKKLDKAIDEKDQDKLKTNYENER